MDHERTPEATMAAPQLSTAQSQVVEETTSHPEGVQILVPSSGDSNSGNDIPGHEARHETVSTEQPLLSAASHAYSTLRDAGRETSSAARHLLSAASETYSTLRHAGRGASSTEQHILTAASEAYPTLPRSHENPTANLERFPPPPPVQNRDEHAHGSSHHRGLFSGLGFPRPDPHHPGIDQFVPVDTKSHTRRTIGERLAPTIVNAMTERDKYSLRVAWAKYTLNIAIGLQVFLGALTTLLAAAVTSGKQAQISTSILGGLSTLVASYLARVRGSGEPELSILRVNDLEQFLREARAFRIDHEFEYANPKNDLDARLEYFRWRLEELLGNADGQTKFSPTATATTRAVP